MRAHEQTMVKPFSATMMNWVNEKEEWLVDWNDAKHLGQIEIQYTGSPGANGVSGSFQPSHEDDADLFFSDVIEAAGRCIVCRAGGSIADVFDISPTAHSLDCWRIILDSPVVPDIGISFIWHEHENAFFVFLLTKTSMVHRVRVSFLPEGMDLMKSGSTSCNLASSPCSFCALSSDLVTIASQNGSLHGVCFGPLRFENGTNTLLPNTNYEFNDVPYLQRITSGRKKTSSSPAVVALTCLGSATNLTGSFRLLAFSVDGQLRLWEATRSKGQILAAQQMIPTSDNMAAVVAMSAAYLKASASGTEACMILRTHQQSTVYVIKAPVNDSVLSLTPVDPPFAGAVPRFVAMSKESMWGVWSESKQRNVEYLYRKNMAMDHANTWEACALDACLLDPNLPAHRPLCQIAAEGCASAGSSSRQRAAFLLRHQHDVWRSEEDDFSVFHLVEALETQMELDPYGGEVRSELADSVSTYHESFDRRSSVENAVLRWWVSRIFLPGRFSSSMISSALQECGSAPSWDGAGEHRDGNLQHRVEDHCRHAAARRLGMSNYSLYDNDSALAAPPSANTKLQMGNAIAAVADELLQACCAIWRRRRQVRAIAVSALWAPHAWCPPGETALRATMGKNTSEVMCPILLCSGGFSCVRAIHCWWERWWSTLHLTLDLSHEQIELHDVQGLSGAGAWKFCATSWFLSRCIQKRATLTMLLNMQRRGSLPSLPMHRFVSDIPPEYESHLTKCAQDLAKTNWADQLQTISTIILHVCSPEMQPRVNLLDKVLLPLQGTWLDMMGSPILPNQGDKWVSSLSDLLRGSIAVSECEYMCAAARDLLLMCKWVLQGMNSYHSGAAELRKAGNAEEALGMLTHALDQQLPIMSSMHQSMRMEVPHRLPSEQNKKIILPMRGCDMWASAYRIPSTIC